MDTQCGRNARIGAVVAAAACLTVVGPAAPAQADGDEEGQRQAPPAAAAGGPLLPRPGVQVRPRAGATQLPKLSALSWMVTDARTGRVLAARDAHRPMAPASTLKTLFAVTLLPKLPQATLRTVTAADLAGVGAGSSRVGVKPGKRYTVADLWRGVFLSSGNDAVRALAAMNGSMSETISQMRAKARALGAHDTRVASADGYDAPGQVSSAYDLTLFARAGLADPRFVRYASTPVAKFPTGRGADGRATGSYEIRNTNRLLVGAPGLSPYAGLIGVKNGYTSHAGNTLVVAARRGGRTLVVTVMNPRSGMPNAVYREAGSLLDWGFASANRVSAVGSLPAPRSRSVASAVHRHPAAAPAATTSTVDRMASVVPHGPRAVRWLAAGAGSLALCAGGLMVHRRRRARRTLP
ncbi:D-alanyl-D-alanine carboxypeptidase family protein [Streptomyces sp. KR80]|uniref:D-alanyl-D-alanine carboxypeptidase family protein n=1 Tax=Streptomyces sp. KR80 TaxID=3457426 RepID=UPI003FD5EE02